LETTSDKSPLEGISQTVIFKTSEIDLDQGKEFKEVFRDLADNMGLHPNPKTAWNPQSNAILEYTSSVQYPYPII